MLQEIGSAPLIGKAPPLVRLAVGGKHVLQQRVDVGLHPRHVRLQSRNSALQLGHSLLKAGKLPVQPEAN